MDLREKIAREVMTYEAGFENPHEIADRILAIPEIAMALKDERGLPPLTNEQYRAILDKIELGHSITVHRD